MTFFHSPLFRKLTVSFLGNEVGEWDLEDLDGKLIPNKEYDPNFYKYDSKGDACDDASDGDDDGGGVYDDDGSDLKQDEYESAKKFEFPGEFVECLKIHDGAFLDRFSSLQFLTMKGMVKYQQRQTLRNLFV